MMMIMMMIPIIMIIIMILIIIMIIIIIIIMILMDSLRGSSVKLGTIQRRFAWPLRKDDTHTSRSVNDNDDANDNLMRPGAEPGAPGGGAGGRVAPAAARGGQAPNLS